MRWFPILSALLLVACDAPGACEQKVVRGSVRFGQCVEVDHPGQCPFFESGDGPGEFVWEFSEGSSCKKQGYEFDCGDGIWEDVESECFLEET